MSRILTLLCVLCLLARPACAQEAGAQADSIAHLINTYQERANTAVAANNYDDAIGWELKVLDIVENSLGKESQEYALILTLIAGYLDAANEPAKGLNLATQALNIITQCANEQDENYILVAQSTQKIKEHALGRLNDYRAQADSAVNRSDWAEALRWEQTAGQFIKEAEGESTGYALSLNQQSVYNAFQGDYTKAIALVQQAMQVWAKVAGTDTPNYQTMAENLAHYESYRKITVCQAKADSAAAANDYRAAIRWKTQVVDISKATIGTQNNEYIMAVNDLAIYHLSLGEYAEAVRLGEEVLQLQKEVMGEDNQNYATYLENLGEYKAALGEYTAAIELNRKALETRQKVQGDRHPDYAATLTKLSKYYFDTGDARTALQMATQAAEILSATVGKQTADYAGALNELARYNVALANLPEAIRLGKEAVDIQRDVLGEKHPNYARSMSNLAQYYFQSGNYQEAVRLGTEALGIQQELFGDEHPDCATSLNNLAEYYAGQGNYQEAIRLTRKALDIRKKTVGEEHPYYISTINNLANFYFRMGSYPEAIRTGADALQRAEKVLGQNHPNYAMLLSNLGMYYDQTGDYQKAIELHTAALRIRKVAIGEKHPLYAQSLINLGNVYFELGNYPEAIRLTEQAATIQKEVLGERHPDYATALNNLGLYYQSQGNDQTAIDCYNRALNIQKEVLGESHPSFAAGLSNLALLSQKVGNDTATVRLLNASLAIQKKNGRENHIDYAKTLSILSGHQLLHGKTSEALNLQKKELKIIENTVGKQHAEYINQLGILAVYEVLLHRPEATALCHEVTRRLTDNVRQTFAYLTNSERTLFWQKNRYWFSPFIHQAAYAFPSDSLAANAYNGLLLSKGLLLNSEIELGTLLAESGDAEVEALYNDLKLLRLQLNKLYEQPVTERALSTDSLEREAQRLERALVQRSKAYGDFTRNLAIDWQQVQQRLGERDVAVEFASFATGRDSVMYAAYCLRRGDRSPRMVPLFEEKQLKAVGATHYYDRPDVARLVWQPLAEELEDADRVYFAPDGELYNIAIESVPHWADSLLVSDHYRFYRLSSTRQLALAQDGQSADEAALYGGLRYDTDVATLVNDSRRRPATTRTADVALFHLADSLNLRAGLQDLPATLTEAEEIETHLRNAGTHATLYTDTAGTETSFKALSGRRTRLMHIATHGFYWTEREAQAIGDRLAFLNTAGQTARYVEDKALTRSGLFFAGVNHALEGEPLPADVDDGILTAREISTLDLRGLDLVVLSACQTGLGEITGDGVFGLQRGFKKAGARTLLMSLWKVDDQATQLLMTRFYANLTAGQSKAESLREAQRYVREYEVEQKVTPRSGRLPLSAHARQQALQQQAAAAGTQRVRPYQSPRFWAAFILLDALD